MKLNQMKNNLVKKIAIFSLCCLCILDSGCITTSISQRDAVIMTGLIIGKYLYENSQKNPGKKKQAKEQPQSAEVKQEQAISAFNFGIDKKIKDAIWNYEHFKYSQTIELLESLSENLTKEQLLTIHAYLGASYYLKNLNEKAKENFENVLSIDSEFQLDSNRFPPHMIEYFENIKSEVITK